MNCDEIISHKAVLVPYHKASRLGGAESWDFTFWVSYELSFQIESTCSPFSYLSLKEENLRYLDGNPRQSRIFRIASSEHTANKISIRSPQEALYKTSKPKTFLQNRGRK